MQIGLFQNYTPVNSNVTKAEEATDDERDPEAEWSEPEANAGEEKQRPLLNANEYSNFDPRSP